MMKPDAVTSRLETPFSPLFDKNPEVWGGIAPLLREKRLERAAHILSHGDQAQHLWLVSDGWVKLTRHTPDGKETVIGLCTQGDIFGEAALFSPGVYPYTAEVVSGVARLVCIPAAAIRELVARDRALAVRVMAMLNDRAARTQLKLEQMNTMSAAQRLGCFLLRLCQGKAGGAITLHIPLEKNVLAAYLGMKPETFSRSQQQLKPIGIHTSGADIAIENIGRLRAFVCASCSESGSCEPSDRRFW